MLEAAAAAAGLAAAAAGTPLEGDGAREERRVRAGRRVKYVNNMLFKDPTRFNVNHHRLRVEMSHIHHPFKILRIASFARSANLEGSSSALSITIREGAY